MLCAIGARFSRDVFRLMALNSVAALLTVFFCANPATADVTEFFDTVGGAATGEFGWDDFTGAYGDPHLPDQANTGIGSGVINAAGDGLISGTNNLYSFFSVPTFDVQLSGLDTTDAYTSLVVQFATATDYPAAQFTLAGQAPDEFIELGQRTEIGGFAYNFFWAEWQGLDASDSFTVTLAGTGQHQSFAGAKATYFNTASSFDIAAVPEPGSTLVIFSALGAIALRRRK